MSVRVFTQNALLQLGAGFFVKGDEADQTGEMSHSGAVVKGCGLVIRESDSACSQTSRAFAKKKNVKNIKRLCNVYVTNKGIFFSLITHKDEVAELHFFLLYSRCALSKAALQLPLLVLCCVLFVLLMLLFSAVMFPPGTVNYTKTSKYLHLTVTR